MTGHPKSFLPSLVALAWLATGPGTFLRAEEGGAFRQGNAFYAAGQYTKAARSYEDAVRLGNDSANLFYNLGDTYYRLGDKGRAVLNYRRALRLEPAHTEAAANLAFVTGGKPGVDRNRAFAAWEAVAWGAAVCGWIGAAGLLTVLFSRRRSLGAGLAFGGLLLCTSGAGLVWYFDAGSGNGSPAVVLAEAAPARYSPDDSAKVIASLSAGGEVRILSEQGAWMYVQLADGTTRAWMSSRMIAPLVPP